MKIERKEFENIRIELYGAFQAAGILQCLLPLKYVCDYDEYHCAMCGMRHAIDHILRFDFYNAYKSNPFVYLFMMLGLFMVVDTTVILIRRKRGKEKK